MVKSHNNFIKFISKYFRCINPPIPVFLTFYKKKKTVLIFIIENVEMDA